MCCAVGVWDIRLEGKKLALRSAHRKIDVLLNFLPNGISITRGRFLSYLIGPVQPIPYGVIIAPDTVELLPNRARFVGGTFRNCRVGIAVR